MTKRYRQYRTGSVHRAHKTTCPHKGERDAKCGCIWRASLERGYTMTGGRKRVTVSGKTEAEVKAKLRTKEKEIARGEDTAGRTTVKAWAATWLEMTATRVRPKTHVTDKGAVRYIVAAIGHRRLDQLTPADVRAVRAAVVADGLSTSTALRYHGTLMRMLKTARDEGHDVAARVLSVKPPTKAVNDRRAIPLTDSLALLSVAAELPHGSRWVAALLQGMRQGECLGLTWEQVDLAAESLTISWQLQALNYRDKKNRKAGFLIPDGYEVRQLEGRMHLVRPKSDAGWRVIPLVPWMTEALKAWRTAQAQNAHLRRSEAAYNLVWPALDGGPANLVEDREEWHIMQETVGVHHPTRVDKKGRPAPYHVHEARHATAMMLLALKVPESVRIQIMGHSSIASTRAYEHLDIELARQALTQAAGELGLAIPQG